MGIEADTGAHGMENAALTESKSPQSVIWAVGELGGGTNYFSENNIVGFYRELKKDIEQGHGPDHIIFNGELLPSVPNYASKGGRAKLLVMNDVVSDLDGACVYMKPHISRIVEAMEHAGKRDAITYLMSESDFDNVDVKYDRLVNAYNREPQVLLDLFYNISEKIIAQQDILKGTENTLAHYEKQRANETDEAKQKHQDDKIRDVTAKINAHKKELADYQHLEEQYMQLLKLWFKENADTLNQYEKVLKKFDRYRTDELLIDLYLKSMNDEKKAQVFEDINGKFEKINKQLEKEKSAETVDAKKVEELIEEAKVLSNLIEKQSFTDISKTEKSIDKQQLTKGVNAYIYRFVNLLPGTKEMTEIANDIAMSEMQISIRDVFGWRTRVNIVSGELSFLNINGTKVMITHDPIGASKQVRKDYRGAVQNLINTSPQEIDLIVTAHSLKASEETYPWRNQSKSYVHHVALPTFYDKEKIKDDWNKRRKTVATKAAGKMPVTSGLYKIRHSGVAFETEFCTSEYLGLVAERERKAQFRALARNLERLKPLEITLHDVDNKEQAQIKSKLPSEMSNKLTNEMLLLLGIDPSDKERVARLGAAIAAGESKNDDPKIAGALKTLGLDAVVDKSKFTKMNFVVLTDMHIGSPGMGEPALFILDGIVDYLSKSNQLAPYTLLLLGDNIEGNLRFHKNELNVENDPYNADVFAKFLKEKGIDPESKRYKDLLNEYKALLFEKTPIHNIDRQVDRLLERIEPIVSKANMVYIISGNHLNKTDPHKTIDESTKLGSKIKDMFKLDDSSLIPGGDYGAARRVINGKEFFFIHKPHEDPVAVVDRSAIEGTVFSGDKHVFRKNIVDNRFSLTSPCLQGNTGYPETVGFAISESLRGFSLVSLVFDEANRHPIISSTKFVTLKELIDGGYVKSVQERSPLIKEFEAAKRETTRPEVETPIKLRSIA